MPKDSTIVRDYHTHGAENLKYNSNVFSDSDKWIHSMAPNGHTSYLGTISEGFKKMENGVASCLKR